MGSVEAVLGERLASLVAGMGYEYVGCEWQQVGRRTVLRLYIDREGGVDVTGCALISRQAGALMDAEGLSPAGHYSLEVSSPGIERPLFTADHYRQHVGRRASLRLKQPVSGRRHLQGVLLAADGEQVTLQLAEGETFTVSLDSVGRAHLVADLFQEKKS